ncbi:hypothetical protein CCP2SC5_580009 [Azospirillaceae bacterium]
MGNSKHCFPLFDAHDPLPVELWAPDAKAPILFCCDHADRIVPARLNRLGLHPDVFDRHIAYDIGAAAVTRRLAEYFHAPAVLSVYSRLVIDVNRAWSDSSLIPLRSDGVSIPGNHNLSHADVQSRIDGCLMPYYCALDCALERILTRGQTPILVSIHSFTPRMNDFDRPWEIGVLWDYDPRIPRPLILTLSETFRLRVGDNLPYSGRNTQGGVIETFASPRGFPNVLIELRQDLIYTDDGAAFWAALLMEALTPILQNPGLNCAELYPRPIGDRSFKPAPPFLQKNCPSKKLHWRKKTLTNVPDPCKNHSSGCGGVAQLVRAEES